MTDITISTAQGGTDLTVDVAKGTDITLDVSIGNEITLTVDKGIIGPQGPQGEQGPAGQGVASGGLTGQVLYKTSNTDYATGWETLTTTQVIEGTNLYYTDARARASNSAGTGISYNSTTGVITNSAPDQTVVLTAGTGISTSGTYPNFTITNTSPSTGGTVTAVTATTPITSTGGTTPVIAMPAATASVNGYLTSTDWITFNSKGSGTVTAVTGTAPVVSSGGTTPAISMPKATSSVDGYLSATDFTAFNAKGSGTVTSVAATVPSFLNVSGSPITTSGTLALTYSGTALPVANGGTGVTASSGANSVVLRDASENITANSINEGFSNVVAAGTTTVLTVSSAPNYVVTGSGGQTYQLPNATTLQNGVNYTFNNNQSSGTIVVKNNSSTTVATIQSGGFVEVILLSNSIAAGSWDVHNFAPSNVSWSTNTFDYAGSITSATWNGNAVQVNRGGTGASTLTGYVKGAGTTALTASTTIPNTDISGLGTIATQNANAVAITGGTIDNTPIGATTPSTGTFTTITGQTEVLKGTGQNLVLQSQTFSGWTNPGYTLTSNSTTAPDSTTTASTLVPQNNTSAKAFYRQVSSNAYPMTASIYAKPAGYNWIALSFGGFPTRTAFFNVSTGVLGSVFSSGVSATITSVGSGWYRCTITSTLAYDGFIQVQCGATDNFASTFQGDGTSGAYIWGAQLEIGSTANTYIPTTTTAVYGTPSLSFSGVAGLGLQSDGSLYVSPAGTGALQAQATTSSTTGGNARGANAVDWQTSRNTAAQVASGTYSVLGGGNGNSVSGSAFASTVAGGASNNSTNAYTFIGGGTGNSAPSIQSNVVAGKNNSASGIFNFIGAGFANSGTAQSAVTTQSATMNATTAVTLAASNAAIKVGQYVFGTSIAGDTYVAAISGTALTLSQNASGSSTSTLSFYTPHGVVVGGGNNQATGAYSFIGGGGDAGTAANRNVASGDWSFVGGGERNTASGTGSVIVGGGISSTGATSPNASSGISSIIGGGYGNTSSGTASTVTGGASNTASGIASVVSGGSSNGANASYSSVNGGTFGTARAIQGYTVFPSCSTPIASTQGITQAALLILARETTDATATVLTSNSSAAGTTNQVILPNNSAYYFKGEVVSGVTGGGNSKGWEISGLIKRGANAAATTLVGSTVTSLYADAGAATWTIAVTADTTNGGLAVTFTGQASTTIRTVCQIRTTEMTY